MHWPSYVEKKFYLFLENTDKCPPDLIRSLKTSDKTKPFLANLASEISKAERLIHKRRGTPLKMSTIDGLIDDMSRLLLRGIMNEADKRSLSYLEKKRQEYEKQYYEDLDSTVDGKPKGEFEELEIVQSETKEVSGKTD